MMRILFVDDEANVLSGLQRSLRSQRKIWDMHFALGGDAAIEWLARDEVDVLVTDMRMPGRDGADVLAAAARLRPGAGRLVLSGQAPREVLARCAELAHRMLWKPCAAEDLIAAIEDVLSTRTEIGAPEIEQVMTALGGPPVLDQNLRRLLGELARPEVDLPTIADAIAADLGLSARVLRLANAALYSMAVPVQSVRHAVELLGVEPLAAMLAALGLIDTFPAGQAHLAEALHRHSTAVASFVRAVAPSCDIGCRSELALTAGMLHDIAQWHITARRPEWMVQVRERTQQGEPLEQVERDVYGTTHARLGAAMLAQWGFTHDVVRAVARHHAVATSPSASMGPAGLLALADEYVDATGGPDRPPGPIAIALGLAPLHVQLIEIASGARSGGIA